MHSGCCLAKLNAVGTLSISDSKLSVAHRSQALRDQAAGTQIKLGIEGTATVGASAHMCTMISEIRYGLTARLTAWLVRMSQLHLNTHSCVGL